SAYGHEASRRVQLADALDGDGQALMRGRLVMIPAGEGELAADDAVSLPTARFELARDIAQNLSYVLVTETGLFIGHDRPSFLPAGACGREREGPRRPETTHGPGHLADRRPGHDHGDQRRAGREPGAGSPARRPPRGAGGHGRPHKGPRDHRPPTRLVRLLP